MTVYLLLVVLTKTTQLEPVRRQEINTTEAVFASADKCLRNKVANEAHYREMGQWDQIYIECIPQEIVKGK